MWRHYRLIGFLAMVFVATAIAASAATKPSPAMEELETAVRQALSILKNPAYSQPEQKETRRKMLQDVIYPEFDFQRMAQGAVGLPWKKFTPDQQERFTKAFRSMLESTYLNMIERYSGEEVTFTNEASLSSQVLRIDSLVLSKGQKYDMSYRLYPKGDKWLVFDIIIEGVSVIANYRSQFKQLLHSAEPDIEGLLVRMQDKIAENQ